VPTRITEDQFLARKRSISHVGFFDDDWRVSRAATSFRNRTRTLQKKEGTNEIFRDNLGFWSCITQLIFKIEQASDCVLIIG